MEKLEKVYDLTKKLHQLLDQPIDSKNRETVIEQLNELIEERGKWMSQLSDPYTNEENELGEKVYQLNLEIEENMQRLFTDLKKEMTQMKRQKKTQQSYVNPYKNLSVSDGVFLDKKN